MALEIYISNQLLNPIFHHSIIPKFQLRGEVSNQVVPAVERKSG